jgi:hypothetical protein
MEHQSSSGLETEGRTQLLAWLAAPGDPPRSQSSLSRQLGLNQSAVSQWARGLSRPDAHMRDVLEFLCGIPARAWQTPAERAVVLAARLGRLPVANDALAATGTGG